MEITREGLDKRLAELEGERQMAVMNLGRVDGAIVTLRQLIAQLEEPLESPKDTPPQ